MTDRSGAPAQTVETLAGSAGEAMLVGDPRLHQVRDFLDDQEASAQNPLLVAMRAFRGRHLLTLGLALLLAVLFGAGAFYAVFPQYQSQGLIRVAARVPKIMYADPNDPRLRLFDSFVSAEVTYLQSRPVLERALLSLTTGKSPGADPVMDIGDLGRMISVRKDKGLIMVAATAASPEGASRTVNALLDSYTALHTESSNQAQTIRERQLVDREQELLEKLAEINANILEVGEEHGTASIAKAHLNKVTQLEDIDQRISELETTIAQEEAQESATEFDTGDDEIKRVTVLDKAMADMTYDRAKRAAALESLKLRYRTDHPKVRELESQIAVIDSAIEARRQQIVTLGKTGALTTGGEDQDEESLAGLRALRKKLHLRRAEVADQAKQLNSKLIELTFLREEHSEVRSLLDETRRALEEVRVESRNSLPGSVEVIAFGATPRQPVEDKRMKLAVAGTGFGILSALGLVVLGGLLRPRLRYSDDLASAVGEEALLGVLPSVEGGAECHSLAVHRIRNRLQLADDPGRRRAPGLVVTVCAARSGTGVSTVAQTLAESFNAAGVQTALLDADLNDATLSRRLALSEFAGLREAITTGRIEPSSHLGDGSRLHVVPAGVDGSVCDKHLSLPQVRSVMNDLRNRHQVIVVDAGPIDSNLSASLMAALSDQVVVVVRAGEKALAVRRVEKLLGRDAARPPLFVFNAAIAGDPGLISCDVDPKGAPPVAAIA